MRWLLYVYPRDWRRRYGAEFGELLARLRWSPGLMVDVLLGALDAHCRLAAEGPEEAKGERRMGIWARMAPVVMALVVVGGVALGVVRGSFGAAPGTLGDRPAVPGAVVGQAGREQVVLQADLSAVPRGEQAAWLEQAVAVTARRLAAAGLAERTVQALGDGRIGVVLPPGADAAALSRLLTTEGRLEFREEVAQADGAPRWVVARVADAAGRERALTGQYFEAATPATDPGSSRPVVLFELDAEGQALLAALTERLLGQRLGIFVDDELYVALTVRSPIVEGRGQISGSFSPEEARTLAIQLAAGPLPVPLRLADPPKS
jgi:hypothetical protein